jgi:hypothetical protein
MIESWDDRLSHYRIARRQHLLDLIGAPSSSAGVALPPLWEQRSPAVSTAASLSCLPLSRGCAGYYTLLTGTAFAKTRRCPATLVLLLRGIAKGEPTARLARELGLSRKQVHTLRHRVQANLNATAPTEVMRGTAFEADELYQNAGKKAHPTVTLAIRHAAVPISAKGTAPMPTIARPSSVWCPERRASIASGYAITRTGRPATT